MTLQTLIDNNSYIIDEANENSSNTSYKNLISGLFSINSLDINAISKIIVKATHNARLKVLIESAIRAAKSKTITLFQLLKAIKIIIVKTLLSKIDVIPEPKNHLNTKTLLQTTYYKTITQRP